MFETLLKRVFGDKHERDLRRVRPLVDEINAACGRLRDLGDEQLRARTAEFRARVEAAREGLTDPAERREAEQEALAELLPEAFAVVKETCRRLLGRSWEVVGIPVTWDMVPYDVQLVGGVMLHEGRIAEMATGEGKTLVATMPLYLNALTGRGVHLITVNDYLARRDARWMAPIYQALGLSIGVLQMAARTENGKKAFLVDLDKESPHEDQHQLRMVPRAEAYAADIIYGTNSEFGFDYLRDNMTPRMDERVQRGHYFAIVDEVDNVLIDEARTPLIISGPAQDESEWYNRLALVVRQLREEDYELSERDRNVTLTEIGEAHVEELLGVPLRDPDRPEDVTHEQARLMGYLEQALRAQFLFKRNKDYLVQAGKVVIVDEFTGRLMPGRRWSDGLHQAVEAKEGARVQSENVTYATITIQNYFRMYEKLSGMTGTAITEAEEFDKIYKLQVLAIPTNLEHQALRDGSLLMVAEDKDEQGYKFQYYTRRDDPARLPVYWRRKDYPDIIFRTEEMKFRAICTEIMRYHVLGRPLLVGTTSVELSDRLSGRLKAEPLRRLAQVMLLRRVWMDKNNRGEDGRQIPELQFLNNIIEFLDLSEMRKLARSLDISFNPEEPGNLSRLLGELELPESQAPRLKAVLEGGIPHAVLNARKHTEESQIIAGAGAFGAVTIATNMAGRGVDIKLGGELPESTIKSVNRVLKRAGHPDPYDLRMEERLAALGGVSPEQYGIYQADVQAFLDYMENMRLVKELGGLHVIGSERHEARRIDNQLRGRAARQGDPGSSRFYLSLEDELMRRFGGQQAEGLMQRLRIDDAVPIEVGLVSRLVEQSQTRVEGANFDVRKHLLEYDDVLNSQRQRIYGQRDLIFTKDDLHQDVVEMLATEVQRRAPQALADEQGPWKLLDWLDSIQPTLNLGGVLFPSYSMRLLMDHLTKNRSQFASPADVQEALLRLAGDALQAENEYLLHAATVSLESTRQRLDETLKERREAVDTFFEGLGLEEGEEARSPRQLLDELQDMVHVPLRLSPEEQRLLRTEPSQMRRTVSQQVEVAVTRQAVVRLLGALERRLGEPLELNPEQLPAQDWDALEAQVMQALESTLTGRAKRLLSEEGGAGNPIARDLENALAKTGPALTQGHLLSLLLMMPQGARASFDKKTHRRVMQRTTRLTYIYLAARLLKERPSEQITAEVLKHLEAAQETMRRAWGSGEFTRLANTRLSELDERTRLAIRSALDEDTCRFLEAAPLQSLDRAQTLQLVDALGRRALSEVYRQVLLGVITELWVDYLTQMEGLRVSIGLEAYAQRDPLVQYKSKASELFQTLLSDMRSGVITRMFTYRPRDLSSVQSEIKRAGPGADERSARLPEPVEAEPEAVDAQHAASDDDTESQPDESDAADPLSRSQKRRRRRH